MSCRLALLLIAAICVAAESSGQSVSNSTQQTASTAESAQETIKAKQSLSNVYTRVYLEFSTALAWNSFASSVFSLYELDKQAQVAPSLEEDSEESEDENISGGSYTPYFGPATQPQAALGGLYANPYAQPAVAYPNFVQAQSNPYLAQYAQAQPNPYLAQYAQAQPQPQIVNNQASYNPWAVFNPTAYTTQQPTVSREEQMTQLENLAEESLVLYLKNSQLENMLKLDQAQKSNYQNTLAIAAISASNLGSDPKAVQMVYLLKYKNFLETLSSSASIIRQDAWTLWNYNEIMETKEFSNGKTMTESFRKTLALSKSAAMHAYFHEAQLDLINLYLDYYLQAASTSVGSLSSFSTGNSSFSALLELETEQSSMPSASAILSYTNNVRFYTRLLNYIAAQSYAFESQLELYLSHDTEIPDHNTRDAADKMLDFVHVQCMYSLRGLGLARLTLASLDLTIMAMSGAFSGSIGSSLASSLGSFGSLGTSLAASVGSLVPAAGSLGLASLAGLGAQGSLALTGIAGSAVGGSHGLRAASNLLQVLAQEESASTPAVAAPETVAVSQPAAAVPAPVSEAVDPVAESVPSPVTGLAAAPAPAPAAPSAAFTATDTEYHNLIG